MIAKYDLLLLLNGCGLTVLYKRALHLFSFDLYLKDKVVHNVVILNLYFSWNFCSVVILIKSIFGYLSK